MRRNRWQDNLCCIVLLVIFAGIVGLLNFLGFPPAVSIILSITLPILFILLCCLQGRRNKKKSDSNELENPPDIPSLENFKYCIKCGAEMEKELKTCTNCGQPFEI